MPLQVDNFEMNLHYMKNSFSGTFLMLLLFLSTTCLSQNKNGLNWYGELHAGWQATLNAYPYSAQLKQGFENKPLDSSKHYAAYFKNQLPIELAIGLDNNKGFRFQFSANYYSMKMALSNPPNVQDDEQYLLANAQIITTKVHALMDYSSLSGPSTSTVHFISGLWTGITMPIGMEMNTVTTNHFGIISFQKNIVWTVGLELILNIDISKKFYLANCMSFALPVSGNFGKLIMQDNSSYTAGDPVKTTSFSLSSGIGMHFK